MSDTGQATFVGGALDLSRMTMAWPPAAVYLAPVRERVRLAEFRGQNNVEVETAKWWQDEYRLIWRDDENRNAIYRLAVHVCNLNEGDGNGTA